MVRELLWRDVVVVLSEMPLTDPTAQKVLVLSNEEGEGATLGLASGPLYTLSIFGLSLLRRDRSPPRSCLNHQLSPVQKYHQYNNSQGETRLPSELHCHFINLI